MEIWLTLFQRGIIKNVNRLNTVGFKNDLIEDVQWVSEKLISFRNLLTHSRLSDMKLNNMDRKLNSKLFSTFNVFSNNHHHHLVQPARISLNLSLTSPYRSSLLAGLQGYIPYPHVAAVCMFVLVVLLLPGHMRGSIGVHHLWARLCYSCSVLRAWFV